MRKGYQNVKCIVCEKDFKKRSIDVKRYPNHCCSIECRNKNNDKRITVSCSQCFEQFLLPPSMIRNQKNVFCSVDCANMFQTTKQEIKCFWCGKMFVQHQCIIKRAKHAKNCCSRDCAAKLVYKKSFIETEFEKILFPLGIKFERNCRTIIKPMELDFYFPQLNFAVEINGAAHYKPIYGLSVFKKQKDRDRRKRKKCRDLGIKLRTVKPGNCRDGTHLRRLKQVAREIRKMLQKMQVA